MADYAFPSRWSGLKRGWKRRKASLRSSRGWSTVESKCRLCFHFPFCLFFLQSADLSLFTGMMRKQQQTIKFRAALFSIWYWLWEEDRRDGIPGQHGLASAMFTTEDKRPSVAISLDSSACDRTTLRSSVGSSCVGTSQQSKPRTSIWGFFGRSRGKYFINF